MGECKSNDASCLGGIAAVALINRGRMKADEQSDGVASTKPSLASNDFLKEFYKECGREVTLAYTTLNQMKNWAIVVTAALLAAFASFWRQGNSSGGDGSSVWLVALAAASLSLLFNTRFFIRAAICYVNLLRWNRLQKAIVSFKLEKAEDPGVKSEQDLLAEIDVYYHQWCSPINRWEQVISNLKLGFGLLLVIPLLVVAVCGLNLYGNPVGMAVLTFVVLGVGVELYEFLTTTFLDTLQVKQRRKAVGGFPGPSGRGSTIGLWVLAFMGSVLAYYIFLCRQGGHG